MSQCNAIRLPGRWQSHLFVSPRGMRGDRFPLIIAPLIALVNIIRCFFIPFFFIPNELYFIIDMFSKTLILLLALLLMQQVQTQSTSLCIDCLISFGGYCIACKTTANNCMIGSTYNATTKLCECNSMFYQAKTTAGYPYCDRCFVGCLTCSGPLATNCLTCVSNFTFNSNNSTCNQPATTSDYSVQFAYYFLNFNLLSNWGWDTTSTTYLYNGNRVFTCNSYTLAGLARAQYITGSFYSLQNHFQARVMFAHYYFATSVNENIYISVGSAAVNVPLVGSFNLANNPNISCISGAQVIQTMVDQSLTHTSSTLSLAIATTQSGPGNVWGIRQIFVQIRLCHPSCTTCTGYTYDKCTACADANRISTYTGYSGICVCYGINSYVSLMYQQTSGNTCVYICPNIPTETFGDNVTRNCLTQCPNNSYAYTDVYRCWADCPKTSIVTDQPLFKDKLNWRCVPNCPSATPYANAESDTDRFCYALCPNRTNTVGYPTDYYAVDGLSPRCVSVCPYNTTFKLFGYQGKCIPLCPTGTWGDPVTKLCVSNCTNSPYLYKDNSTGQNICVTNCSYPNNFRDNTTGTCVTACPSPYFGQTNRECITQCAAGQFGLPFDTRQCTSFCPDGWWGEPDKAVCVNSATQCKTMSNNRYADNYTRKCVFPASCSLGWWAQNVTQMCQSNCVKANSPNSISGSSVGDPNTRVCQAACTGGLFADYVAGLCVSTCITNNTYADVYSSYSCVTACNIGGLTPWADNNTWTCVSSCNTTGIANAVRDNTTWQCVFECPPNYYADFITTNNPICRAVCLSNTYADNSTGTGLCVYICSVYPARFGDATGGMNLCVAVCSVNLFGDQTGSRTCLSLCPNGYFAQNDTTRRCVPKCKPGTYGQNRWCNTNPFNCTVNTFANDANNLCDACSSVQSTWGDNTTKRCVTQCPLNAGVGPITYYADISIRQCTLTCSSSYVTGATSIYSVGLWGNNNTRTCEFICLDLNAYVEYQSNNPYRVCVAKCHPLPAFHYANNYTKVCGPSINCPTNTFGENNTQLCVFSCPTSSYGYQTATNKICIDICPTNWYGQNSTGVNLCVTQCASIPPLYADPVTKLCLPACSAPYYADPTTRKCVLNCPYSVTPYYAYDPNRTCITVCPNNYFANFALQSITGLPTNTNISRCVTPSSSCGATQWGDPYLHKCVALCTGPSPVNLFAYWPDCVATCPSTYYANTYNGVRICVQLCPPSVVGTAPPNLYGDPTTMTCVSRCVTPLTWADYQTRLCQATCSASPVPTYSQNFYFTCVTALNCPITPSITFGDNNTRSCVSNCSLGKFGDPTSRNCVTQCPNVSTTLTSTYYSDVSTGVFVCVVICPIKPTLFGLNATNTCVVTCPAPLYGDQTGNRTCLAVCPLIGATVWFAQNTSRICVTVCIAGTWGFTATRECVELPTQCQSQWADNSTNLCVNVCPATANTFADPTTKLCVPFCPPTYYADLTTRTCVQTCPSSVEQHGTFGNNQTRTCSEVCNLLNGSITYADPQTVNRYCVLQCSQSPLIAFADPSTARCVPQCPTFPSLYGQKTTFTCVAACTGSTYADTNARLCVTTCPNGAYKQTSPNTCVSVCPFDEINPLYGDPNAKTCVTTCTNNYFRYNSLSICVPSCSAYNLFAYNMTCVKLCPNGFYANSSNICVSTCPSTTYGQNSTTTCRSTCLTGFASGSLCVAVCPNGSYGQNFVCVNSCQISGNIASSVNNLCIGTCTGTTYAQNGLCSTNCTSGTYANPYTNLCSSSCTNSRYGDPTTNTCVTQCPSGYYKDSTGYCLSACIAPKYADNVTWSCTPLCSTGYWGYNLLCVTVCPLGYFGYLVDRICYTVPNRPVSSPLYFAENTTQTWVTVCPVSPLTFGDITLRYCITNCLTGTFADPVNRRCNTSCQNSSYFADSTTNQCVMVCPNGYFANPNTKLCQNSCSTGYAYSWNRQCVATCPSPYSGYDNGTAKICVNKCPLNYYSYNRVCSTSCPATYYADNATNECLLSCVNSFASDDAKMCVSNCSSYANYKFADNSSYTCVNLCPTTPDYYVDNYACVFTCSAGKFADPSTGVRACTTLCTTGLFSDPLSGRCMSSCPLGYWAQNVTNSCVSQCASGGFADNTTGKCVAFCPSPTYADSTTQRCVKTCPTGYFGEDTNTINICVSKCTLPNYANPLSRRCEATCPASAKLYAQNTTASCNQSCSFVANSYADPAINVCVSACTLANFYALDGLGICTNLCPLGLFMQNSTKKCQATCTTGFAQPTTRYCVAKCFGNPQTYGYNKVCHYKCLNATYNLYADNSTSMCVSTCPTSVSYFSDPLSGNCVLFCPDGYFAQNTTYTCSQTCSVGFADNLTRKCVAVCPTVSQQTYGDPLTSRCVRVCPTNAYAENDTKQCVASNTCPGTSWSDKASKYCVSRCPSIPLTFGLNSTTSCIQRCPLGLFGDFVTQTCLSSCPSVNGQYRFADPITQTCVFVCPIKDALYGDTLITGNFTCVSTCSAGQLRDNSTQRCVSLCPSYPSYWADLNNHTCVYTCPLNYFASSQSHRLCVINCSTYLTFGDINARVCTSICPFNYYADNSTYLCVSTCPSTPDYYADNTTVSCVKNCPKAGNWTTYADPISRKCVTQCPPGYFARNDTQRCVQTCPNGSYADPIIRVCVSQCTVRAHYYKHSDLTCVYDCPTSPMSYKYDGNHSCVYVDNTGYTGCPAGYWANPLDYMCTTLCPAGYFADQTKQLCVTICPNGYYADNVDRLCKTSCSLTPQQYRLNLSIGTCVQFCPSPYFSDNSSYNCVQQCPSTPLMYAYDITRNCVQNCPPPYYSYILTRQCLLTCPSPYFAQDSTRSCELGCISPYFADNSTNRCVLSCPDTPVMFGYNKTCVYYCPLTYFADNSTRLCVSTCPTQPTTFSQNSTRTCVTACPSTPNSFANNITMQCVAVCPNNTFADTISRSCVLHCPSTQMTYADPSTHACQSACPSPYFASDLTKQCVSLCPNTPQKTYALDSPRTCVFKCPNGLFGQNITRTCAAGCPTDLTAFADVTSNLCVSTCPYGWFADNNTFACVRNCPNGAYADNTTRRCLLKCPGTERLFADNTTLTCVSECPTGSFGNDLNWTCIPNCPDSVSGYKLDISHLCVPECPSPYFAYVPTRTCVINCGAGLYGDTATRICKSCNSSCPTCLSQSQCLTCTPGLYLSFGACLATCPPTTYASNQTMSCIYPSACPSGTYANKVTQSCTTTCPPKQFPDKINKLCTDCPATCASCNSTSVCITCVANAAYSTITTQCYAYCEPTLQYSYAGECYSTCPPGSYLDYTNVNCQACNSICKTCFGTATNCTSCDTSYFFNQTCVSQCPTNYFSANQTCLVCNNTVPACVKPLTFNTTTRTQNYQSVIYLQFNQDVKIQGDPSSFISLNLKVNRRLQSYSTMMNNGLPYTATIMPDGTIKIVLDPSVTLVNPSFTVSINDPSKITTASGASLQSLTAAVQNLVLNSYPPGTTSDAPLVVAGTVLSVLMLLVLALVFLCSPVPIYLSLQAFQMIAFYAFITDLAPNFFYFLKKVSLSRLSFLPNILSGVYQQPNGYVSYIPSRAIQIDSKLSFAGNAGNFMFVAIIYFVVGFVIKAISTKSNPNRPLRQIFQKVYQTRVKWSIVWDLLWIFGLNVMVCGFLQFKYTVNSSDLAVAILSLLIFISLPAFAFFYRIKRFDPENPTDVDNFRLIHQGLKQGKSQYMPYIFMLRRLLFAIIIASTAGGSSQSQYSSLMAISCIMMVLLIVVRPYQETLRNIVHIANQVGLTALGVGCVYYKHYVDILEPVGTKIMNGTILTGGMIAHLSIAIIWAIYRTYHYYREIYNDLKATEFYTLYLDEQYDESLEKELQELNDQSGDVQEVEVCNSTQIGDQNEGEETIKLKIKRRRKVKKGQAEQKILPRRDQGEYIKVSEHNQSMIEIEHPKHDFKEQIFQPEIIMIKEKETMKNIFAEEAEKSEQAWVEVNNREELLSAQVSAKYENSLLASPRGANEHVLLPIDSLPIEDSPPNKEIPEISQISSVSHKEEAISKDEGENLRQSISQIPENAEKRSEYNELVSNKQQQIFSAAEFIQNSPREPKVHHQQPVHHVQIEKAQQEQENKQNWRQISQWDQVNPLQPEIEPQYELQYEEIQSEAKQNPKIVIDLDQEQHEQQIDKKAIEKEVNHKWNIEIEDLMGGEQQKAPNKKHMMLFDMQDFE